MNKYVAVVLHLLMVAFGVCVVLTSDVMLSVYVTAITLFFQLSLFWVFSYSSVPE